MKKIIGGVFILVSNLGWGQDLHFSQFFNAPLTVNPSLTGAFKGDFRFSAIHREQWASVSTPFVTSSFSADGILWRDKKRGSHLSGGLNFYSDKAGDGVLALNQIRGFVAYRLPLDGKNFISAGLYGGYAQRSFQPDKLVFEDQMDPETYQAAFPTQEIFKTSNYSYGDAGGGLNWNFSGSKKFSSSMGWGIFHANEPKMGTFKGSTEVMNIRHTVSGGFKWLFWGRTQLVPMALYSSQGKFSEIVYGSNIRFGFEPANGFENGFSLGVFKRRKDALFFYLGLETNRWNFGFSYDINQSSLKVASQSRGAWEISITYIFTKVPGLKGIKIPCPTYL